MLQNLRRPLRGNGDGLPVQGLVGGEEDVALRVADQKVHVGDDGGEAGQALEVQVVLEVLYVQVPAVFQVAQGELAHHPGLGGDFLPLLAPGVVVAQGEKGRPQQAQGQKHHARRDEELPPIEALGPFLYALHPSAFSAASSNLYPTPQTVFSAHFSLTPSTFSRRRLMCTSTVRLSPK